MGYMTEILAIIAGILAVLFGVEHARRKKADKRASDAQMGKHKAETEKCAVEAGAKAERIIAEGMSGIDDGQETYSEAIRDFNEGD